MTPSALRHPPSGELNTVWMWAAPARETSQPQAVTGFDDHLSLRAPIRIPARRIHHVGGYRRIPQGPSAHPGLTSLRTTAPPTRTVGNIGMPTLLNTQCNTQTRIRYATATRIQGQIRRAP